MSEELTGAQKLRQAVNLINNCQESFLDQYTAEQLLALYVAYKRSGWDITPDQWTERQVIEALWLDKAPCWDEDENPVYD